MGGAGRRNARHRASALRHWTGSSGTGRQSRSAWHAAVCRALRGASVRPLGGSAWRWARDYAGRSARSGRNSPGVAAQGRGQNAIFAHCRRPGGFALFREGISLQRSHAPSRRADDARIEPGRHRGRSGEGYVLQRQSSGRAGRRRVPGCAFIRAFRQFRDICRPWRAGIAQKALGLCDRRALSRIAHAQSRWRFPLPSPPLRSMQCMRAGSRKSAAAREY